MTPLQHNYLQQLHDDQTLTAIYLKSGVQLKGYIKAFDANAILIIRTLAETATQLIFEHAIATINKATAKCSRFEHA